MLGEIAGQLILWRQRGRTRSSVSVWIRQLLLSQYAIPVAVFVTFLALSSGITGPAYLSDEVGYLDKASTFAGSAVHMSSSWYGGYSMIVSPAFWLSSDPFVEWRIIMVINALLWAGSAWLLQYVLKRTHPRSSLKSVRLATLGAMLYPSWLAMSSYAFATPGFVFVLMAALAAFLKSDGRQLKWLLLTGLLAGYLCWVHPLGFIFLGLLVVSLAARSLYYKQWGYGVIALGSAAFGLLYVTGIGPWFTHIMSGSSVVDTHYSGKSSEILHAMTHMHYWLQTAEVLTGLLLFAVAATFGLVVYAAVPAVRILMDIRNWRGILQDMSQLIKLMTIFSVVGVILLVAFTSGSVQQLRIDQWVYGRYTDMYLLPVIGFGLLRTWRLRWAIGMAVMLLAAGVLLQFVTNPANTSFAFDNKVNIQAFWPMHLTSVVHTNYYWLWGLLGAVGVVCVGFMGTMARKQWLVLLLVPVALTGVGNYVYHTTILRQHATVTSLYMDIKNTYASDVCIGYTTAPDPQERFSLYSYYLHGYDMSKIPLQQWVNEGCKGPYLTFSFDQAAYPGLRIAQRDAESGLLMVVQGNDTLATRPSLPPTKL